ncbi:MAG: bifunctional pyr operon transcriptional regulator/uracil phosphoribosyltransferase PyrR [Cyclobacteriaceae bacterium]|nr:bifunctional pyr operon transcriptional regulator/uracil phosphoribosyltransferase PyrR [Cyclobacteriaceae bacterium]
MQKRLILDSHLLDITISRLSQQLIENHSNFDNSVIIGLQPKGPFLADLIHKKLEQETGHQIDKGYLDTTFHRDDFRRREVPVRANETKIDFIIEDKNVVIVDDVLYTGRSVRAAMDAMMAFGRPEKVELLVLVDRRYSRDLPIAPDYVGKSVNTLDTQKVLVELEGQGFEQNKIWLVNKEQ